MDLRQILSGSQNCRKSTDKEVSVFEHHLVVEISAPVWYKVVNKKKEGEIPWLEPHEMRR